MDNNKKIIEVPFQKLNDEHFDFQIINMKELLNVITTHKFLESTQRLKFNSIIIILDGVGTHNIDCKTYSYKKGTTFFIAKNQLTSFNLNEKMNCYILEFTDEFFNRLFKSSILDMFDYMRYSPCMQLDSKTLESVINNIKLLNYQLKLPVDELKESIIQSLFQSLLLQLKREKVKNIISIKSRDEKIYNGFIQLTRTSHKYSMKVEDYSRKLDISSKTLTRIINKYLDKPTKVYLNEFLLLEIKRYLLDEGLTLQEIANKLEFDEITNLIKFFKKFEGMAPSEFKREHNRN